LKSIITTTNNLTDLLFDASLYLGLDRTVTNARSCLLIENEVKTHRFAVNTLL